jgi:hypothetical protein
LLDDLDCFVEPLDKRQNHLLELPEGIGLNVDGSEGLAGIKEGVEVSSGSDFELLGLDVDVRLGELLALEFGLPYFLNLLFNGLIVFDFDAKSGIPLLKQNHVADLHFTCWNVTFAFLRSRVVLATV